MATDAELQNLIELIRKVGEASRRKRVQLFQDFKIRKIEWELNDFQALLNYISSVADHAGLLSFEKERVLLNLKNLLNQSPGTPSVAWLEDKLLDLQDELNFEILDNIIARISEYKPKIETASGQLQEAINDLNDLSKAFGAIAVAVNLFAALISASSGNFSSLIGVVSKLL